ncbi:diguanylate cyclase [Hydrogenimonas sp.]|jgi:diguanylate cyclase (GGDEF)-like protein|uniref:diguanylate cyclase n=1 Tax=Hydrogenimonas sp. TaxID=2231112 RepID=UPI00262FEAB5|nr:diguanylate cyclase [Hydrogenimonas sp.]
MKVTRQFDLVLKIGITILTLLTVAMIYLYMQVDKVLASTRQEMIEMIINRYEMELKNASAMVVENTRPSLIERLSDSKGLRRDLQRSLSYFKTPEVEHLFVIYRDERGRLRYLLDGEREIEHQAMFMQRFEPVSDIWERTYETGKTQLYKHMKNGSLWVSIAIPIFENGRVAAVLGGDLSASIRTDVERKFTQIKSMMFTVAVIIALMLVFGYFQIYYYFKGRSKSFVDPLTGAYNRKFLYEVIANANYAEYQIIMYDVDHFKRVNDTFGHEVGDEVLKMLTQRIRKMLRKEDHLVRFGGEEFIVFLHTVNKKEATEVAERLKKSIETSPFVIGKNILSITISVGINNDAKEAHNIDDAIEVADEQLYCAKNAGRNRVCVNGVVVS